MKKEKLFYRVCIGLLAATAFCVPTQSFAVVGSNQVVSSSIRPADGTSGQSLTTGSGVKTGHIQNGAITTSKIAAGAVTDAQITGPISASKISDGTFQKKYV